MPFLFSAIANSAGSTADNRGTAAADLGGLYDTDDEIRIVANGGSTAICYRTSTRIEVYVFSDPAIPPTSISPIFVVENTVSGVNTPNRVVDLLPFSDGTYGFLYWQESSMFNLAAGQLVGPIYYVHFNSLGKDAETGSATFQVRTLIEDGAFQHTAAASVNSQDELLLAFVVNSSVLGLEYDLRIASFTKEAEPITNPGSPISLENTPWRGGLAIYNNESGSSIKLFLRRQPASDKTLLIVGRNKITGPIPAPVERAIDVWTINNRTMDWYGPKNVTAQPGADEGLFSLPAGSLNRIYECFDDESGNFPDAVWFSHDGSSSALRTLHLISPLVPPGLESGQPGDVFISLKTFEGLPAYSLPLRQGAFDDAGRIYTGGEEGPNEVITFDTTQETVGITREVVTPPNAAHRVCRIGRGLVQVGVDSFRALSTGGGTSFLKSAPSGIESGPPSPPESTTGVTFQVTALTTLAIPKGDVLGIAVNDEDTVAILYRSGGSVRIVCRYSDGVLSAPFTIASGTEISVEKLTTTILNTATDNEFFVNYIRDGVVYVARINSLGSGFSTVMPAPVSVGLINLILGVTNRFSFLLYDDGSFWWINDFVYLTPLKYVDCVRRSAAGVDLGNVTILLESDNQANLDFTVRSRQSSGNALVVVTYTDPGGPTIRTKIYTIDPISIALDPALPIELTPGDGVLGDLQGIRDARSSDGLWFQQKNGTFNSFLYTPESPSNPSLNRGPYAVELLSAHVVYDSPDGSWYSTGSDYKIFQQSYLTGTIIEATVEYQSVDQSAGNELLPFVAGTGFLFYGISGNTTNSTIVKFGRTDATPSDNSGTISRIIGVCSVPSLTFSGKKFELHSLNENNLSEMAVLRHERDTDTLFPQGNLYIDLFDDGCSYLGSSIVASASAPSLVSGYGTTGSNENTTPHVLSFSNGDYLVYWAERQASGAGLFKASRRNRDAAHPFIGLGDATWAAPKKTITVTSATAWSAQITLLKDDTFFVSWIDWEFGAATAEVKVRRFGAYGDPIGPAVTVDSFYGFLFFRKRLVAPEYADSQLILVYTANHEIDGKKIRMAIVETPPKSFAPSLFDFPRAADIDGEVIISGFGDSISGQIWIEESAFEPDIAGGVPRAIGKASSLIRADYPDYEIVESSSGGEFLPTKFRRAVFGLTNLPYGIRAGAKPAIYRAERSPISRNGLGALERDGDSNPVQTGVVFSDAAIAGTGERMRVPVYKTGINTEYEVLIVSIRGDAAEPPPGDVLPPVITTTFLLQGVLDVVYPGTTVVATGGGTISWSATGLPAGLTISSGSGDISGTPIESGTFSVDITATNESGASTRAFQLIIRLCDPVTGVDETGGPTTASPVLSPGQELSVPHVIGASSTGLWTSHTFASGVPQGVLLQKHALSGALSGNAVIVQAPKIVVDAPWQSHLGTDAGNNVYVVWGGAADLVSANPRLVRGAVFWAKYSSAGVLLSPPRDITGVQFNGTRLHPSVFVFSDGPSAVVWYEFDALRTVVVSSTGSASSVIDVTEGVSLNPAIAPSITGNPAGAFFDVVFSDGFSLGFCRFDRLGNRLPLVFGIERPGETILAVNAVHSPYDGSLTIAMSVRIGGDKRVSLQRFNTSGASISDRFVTGDAEEAEFGTLAKNVLVELSDGSFVLTYFRNSDATAILRRFDRSMNPIGTPPIAKSGCPGPDYLGLAASSDTNIIWGFHGLSSLDVFSFEIDCELPAPVLPPGFLPPTGPVQCRTV